MSCDVWILIAILSGLLGGGLVVLASIYFSRWDGSLKQHKVVWVPCKGCAGTGKKKWDPSDGFGMQEPTLDKRLPCPMWNCQGKGGRWAPPKSRL